jgi:large subunit ribosomal protein L4
MLEVPVYNETGQRIASEGIEAAALGGRVNAALLKQAVVRHQANQRQGTVAQKGRGEVEGSTRKLYRQKGTGRARMGPIRQPVRRGGGRAFPRKPRDFRLEMPRKMRRLARNQAVLARIRDSEALIVDGLRFDTPKTKRFSAFLRAVGTTDGCLFATHGPDPSLHRSGRNIPRTEILDVANLNAYAILSRPRLIFTREAFAAFRDGLGAGAAPAEAGRPAGPQPAAARSGGRSSPGAGAKAPRPSKTASAKPPEDAAQRTSKSAPGKPGGREASQKTAGRSRRKDA